MNERLAKLTEQCYEYNETMQGAWFNKTKFAELIIRECMTICKKHPSRDLENLWSADAVATDLVHQFSEHFGVEE